MKDLRLTLDVLSGSWTEQLEANLAIVGEVGVRAMTAAVDRAKMDGRASIAAAGFSSKWQNTLRGTVYPNKGIDAAGRIDHKILYAGVFEDGATVKGDPYMWLRLRGVPTRINRKALTPTRFEEQIGDLQFFRSKRGTPLLGAHIRIAPGRSVPSKITLAMLRKGASRSTGRLVTIPLFHAIKQSTVPEKFSVREICQSARDSLPQYYARAFVEVAPNG